MWNHQTQMHNAMAARGIPWPKVSSQELTDMLVYLQNLPQTRNTQTVLLLPAPGQGGEALSSAKKAVRSVIRAPWLWRTAWETAR